MDRKSAFAITTFVGLSLLLGLVMDLLLELIGMASGLAGQIAAYLFTCPIALMAARRAGRVTRVLLLVASLMVLSLQLAAAVYLVDATAAPAGGHFGWPDLFNAMNWQSTLRSGLAALIVPQLWLWLLNTWSGGNAPRRVSVRHSA